MCSRFLFLAVFASTVFTILQAAALAEEVEVPGLLFGTTESQKKSSSSIDIPPLLPPLPLSTEENKEEQEIIPLPSLTSQEPASVPVTTTTTPKQVTLPKPTTKQAPSSQSQEIIPIPQLDSSSVFDLSDPLQQQTPPAPPKNASENTSAYKSQPASPELPSVETKTTDTQSMTLTPSSPKDTSFPDIDSLPSLLPPPPTGSSASEKKHTGTAPVSHNAELTGSNTAVTPATPTFNSTDQNQNRPAPIPSKTATTDLGIDSLPPPPTSDKRQPFTAPSAENQAIEPSKTETPTYRPPEHPSPAISQPVKTNWDIQKNTGAVIRRNDPNLQDAVAKLGSITVSRQELYNQLAEEYGKTVLDRILNRILLRHEIEKRGIPITDAMIEQRLNQHKQTYSEKARQDSPSFEEALTTSYGMTLQEYKDRVVWVEIAIESLTLNELKVTEADLFNYYYQNRQLYLIPEQVRASHIMIRPSMFMPEADRNRRPPKPAEWNAAYELITKVHNELSTGASFMELAAKYSQDPNSAKRGGDLGFFPRNKMLKPIEDAAFGLAKNQVSGIVKSPVGYHVILVTDKKTEQLPPFNDIKDKIEKDYKAYVARSSATSLLQILRKRAEESGELKIMDPALLGN